MLVDAPEEEDSKIARSPANSSARVNVTHTAACNGIETYGPSAASSRQCLFKDITHALEKAGGRTS
jgi:hypothetical protein